MIEKWNITVFSYIDHLAGKNAILDGFSIFLAKYLLFFFILLPIFLWFRRGKGYKNIALYSIYSAALGFFSNFLISIFYYHPRPFMIGLGKGLISHPSSTSFPSDHTTFMLSVAFMLFYFRETRALAIVLSVFGLMGGTARVFCGVHFPLDIIGAAGVALAVSLFIYLLRNKLSILNRRIISLYNSSGRNFS